MAKTVVGVLDDFAEAQEAVQELLDYSIERGVIGTVALSGAGKGAPIVAGPIASVLTGASVGAVTGGLIGALARLGVPDEHARYYAEAVRRGGTLVMVQARNDDIAEIAAATLRGYGAVDIDERDPLEADLAARGPMGGLVCVYGYAGGQPELGERRAQGSANWSGIERRRAA